jgi:heat shock protein HslJ
LLEGVNITLHFSQGEYEGMVSGFASCNSYGSEYTAAGDGILTIAEIARTAIASVARH